MQQCGKKNKNLGLTVSDILCLHARKTFEVMQHS